MGPKKFLLLWPHLPTIVDRKWFFQKFTKSLISNLKRLFGPKKNFQLCAPDYSDSWFADYGEPKMIFQKFTKWHIDSLKRLFGPEKNFASMTTFADYSGSKMIFSKIHQMAYWYSKTLIWARKKFCFYDHSNVVIVDLPTIVSQK